MENKVCSKDRDEIFQSTAYGFLKMENKTNKQTNQPKKTKPKQTKETPKIPKEKKKENNFSVLHFSCYFSYIAFSSIFP